MTDLSPRIDDVDVDALLKRLHLANARRMWRDLCQRAEKEDWTYRDFLTTLVAEEVAHRRQTRLGRLSRKAGFPFLKTIDDFDFTFQSTLRLSMLGSFLAPDFITEGRCVILYGKPGRGKTHLAIAIAYRAIQNGFDASFTTAATLIDELSRASAEGRLRQAIVPYVQPHVLIVDEVGYLAYGADAANVLFHVVNERHLRQRSMIFTTNKSLKAWGRVLHDADLGEAIVDRILERGRLLRLDGPSVRTRHVEPGVLEDHDALDSPARDSGSDRPEFPEPTPPMAHPPTLVQMSLRRTLAGRARWAAIHRLRSAGRTMTSACSASRVSTARTRSFRAVTRIQMSALTAHATMTACGSAGRASAMRSQAAAYSARPRPRWRNAARTPATRSSSAVPPLRAEAWVGAGRAGRTASAARRMGLHSAYRRSTAAPTTGITVCRSHPADRHAAWEVLLCSSSQRWARPSAAMPRPTVSPAKTSRPVKPSSISAIRAARTRIAERPGSMMGFVGMMGAACGAPIAATASCPAAGPAILRKRRVTAVRVAARRCAPTPVSRCRDGHGGCSSPIGRRAVARPGPGMATMRLIPCRACGRHVRESEGACPFCVTPRPIAPGPRFLLPAGRLTRAAIFAFGATVAGCGARTGSDPGEPGDRGSPPAVLADAGADGDAGRPDRPGRDAAVPPVERDAGTPPPTPDAEGDDGGVIALYGAPPFEIDSGTDAGSEGGIAPLYGGAAG